MKTIFVLLALFSAGLCPAATIQLGPGDSINWSTVQPGDTIQLANGNYSGSFKVQKSGTAAAPILIKGPASGSATWKSGWDIGPSNYITVDGGHADPYGIRIDLSGGSGGAGMRWGETGNVTNLTLKYVELIGTPKTSGVTSGNYGLNFAPYSFTRTNLLVDHCRLYQWNETIRASKWKNCVIQFCEIRKTQDDNVDHADLIYCYPAVSLTWRWNSIYESPVDGMFHEYGGADGLEFYGNVLWNSTNHFLSFKAPDTYGPMKIFNNVFQAKSSSQYGWLSTGGVKVASGSILKNNIFWHVSNDLGGAESDHNAYNYTTLNGYGWPSNESGSFTFTGNPFVNMGAGDFHLTATGANLFKGKGVVIAGPPEYALDADGNSRGTSSWDVGAFVANPGGSPTPTPSASPSASPSPSATPTPGPTASPTPKFAIGDWVTPVGDTTVNVRSTPAGAQVGSHSAPDKGQVLSDPTIADFGGVPVSWHQIDWQTGADGWSGDDDLQVTTAAPSPSPSPSATPTPTPGAPTYENWINKQNDWIRANPPTPDR
jgi:hypothetical protein